MGFRVEVNSTNPTPGGACVDANGRGTSKALLGSLRRGFTLVPLGFRA